MAPVPFHYLELRAFSYATEDVKRVETALRHYTPADCAIERSRSSGHHGDPITVLSTRIETADAMRTVIERLFEIDGIERFQTQLQSRIDEECAFYLRFDKQAAFRGISSDGVGIQLRGKVESYPASRERAIENLADFFATYET